MKALESGEIFFPLSAYLGIITQRGYEVWESCFSFIP